MVIKIRAIKKPTVSKKTTQKKVSKSQPVTNKTKPLAAPSLIKLPSDYQPPSEPPQLKPSQPLTIDDCGLFYQSLAQLTGTVTTINGLVYLQLPHAQIKLLAVKSNKKKLLRQLGQTVGIRGWLNDGGYQLTVLSVTQPHQENLIALAGMVKPDGGKINLLVARNVPVKTESLLTFPLTLTEPLPTKSKFIRCLASYGEDGLAVDKITTTAPFPPKYKLLKK